MRKVLLWTTCAAVVLVAVVFTTAHLAVRYPHSVLGRTLFDLGHTASLLNPHVGFAPIIVRLHMPERQTPRVAHLPEQPVDELQLLANRGSEEASGAPIVIPEEDIPVVAQEPVPPPVVDAELPSGIQQVMVPRMPYCDEPVQQINEYEPIATLPTLVVEYELLPEPSVEDEQEPAAVSGARGAARQFLRQVEKLFKKQPAEHKEEVEMLPVPTAEEVLPSADPHHNHPGCRPCYCPFSGKMAPQDQAAKPNQQAKPSNREDSLESAQHKVRGLLKIPARDTWQIRVPVDTLEMRPEDYSLFDFGLPGVL